MTKIVIETIPLNKLYLLSSLLVPPCFLWSNAYIHWCKCRNKVWQEFSKIIYKQPCIYIRMCVFIPCIFKVALLCMYIRGVASSISLVRPKLTTILTMPMNVITAWLVQIMLRKLPIILFPYSRRSNLLFHTDVPIILYHLPIIPLKNLLSPEFKTYTYCQLISYYCSYMHGNNTIFLRS